MSERTKLSAPVLECVNKIVSQGDMQASHKGHSHSSITQQCYTM